MDATGQALKCMIVTPERIVLDEATEFVALPLFDGELGVLANRAPLTGRLGYGELRTIQGGTTHHYYIEGGFVQVRSNVVSVLTPKAVPLKDINVAALESQIPSLTGTALTKAKAQLHVATKSSASH